MSRTLTRAEIETLIPHRAPMLLLDDVTAWRSETEIEATTTYSADTVFFSGHFPGNPILPGIVMVESMAQAAAVLTSLSKNLTAQTATYLFMGMNDVKFKAPVKPGEAVSLKVTKTGEKMGVLTFTGTAHLNGRLACQAAFTAKLIVNA